MATPHCTALRPQVQFDMVVSLYEKEFPSLQAVRVNDTLGYNDNYESAVTVVPEVLAAYESVRAAGSVSVLGRVAPAQK